MPKPRLTSILGFLICVGLLAYAFYMEHVLLLEPCPLCWLQRFVFMGFAVVFLICAIHNPGSWGRYVYVLVFGMLTILGVGLAGRHLWLQSLPAEVQPECGLGVTYMLDVKPLAEVIAWAARGTGECAAIQWTFVGISIPGWTFVAFILLGVSIIISLVKNPGRRSIFH